MMEPWNIRRDDVRLADSLPTFIIFCEDEISEIQYFKYFETSLIKVNTIGGQKSKIDNVFKAIDHCLGENLMEIINGIPVLKQEDIHVWCVFDRDIEENISLQSLGNISFNESIETATSRGIKVAWSNDAFELWVLLHFEDIDPKINENKKRETYYEKLTNIFKSLPNPNEDLVKAKNHASFTYKKDMKSKNNFRSIVRDEIVNKTSDAISRAQSLEFYHKALNNSNHEKAPCTLVYLLVEELLRLGKKSL